MGQSDTGCGDISVLTNGHLSIMCDYPDAVTPVPRALPSFCTEPKPSLTSCCLYLMKAIKGCHKIPMTEVTGKQISSQTSLQSSQNLGKLFLTQPSK